MTPLSYDALDHVSTFASEQCPDGLVAIAANTLRILTVSGCHCMHVPSNEPHSNQQLQLYKLQPLIKPVTQQLNTASNTQRVNTTDGNTRFVSFLAPPPLS